MIQERKKARFNFIDALIILIILAIIGIAAYLITDYFRTPSDKSLNEMSFDVRISNVDSSVYDLLTTYMPTSAIFDPNNATAVKDSATGEVVGYIATVWSEPAKYYGSVAVEEDGVLTLPTTEYEDKVDVYVKIMAPNAVYDSSREIYTVGNTRILIGSQFYFQAPSFTSVSYITDFSTRTPG